MSKNKNKPQTGPGTYPFFAEFITPEKAHELEISKPKRSVAGFRAHQSSRAQCQCGQPVWRYGGCGMCFPCTTGESDASDDYELEPL